jgi:hypothetical protein
VTILTLWTTRSVKYFQTRLHAELKGASYTFCEAFRLGVYATLEP